MEIVLERGEARVIVRQGLVMILGLLAAAQFAVGLGQQVVRVLDDVVAAELGSQSLDHISPDVIRKQKACTT